MAATWARGWKRAWIEREAEDGDPGADGEAVGHDGHDDADHQRDGGRERSQHDHGADEGQHRASAPEAGEDGPGVADHRRRAADVADPPRTAEQQADARRQRALDDVAGEDGDGGATAQHLLGVPVARVAVADGPQVDAPGPPDEHGHRDGAEEVAGDGRDDHGHAGRVDHRAPCHDGGRWRATASPRSTWCGSVPGARAGRAGPARHRPRPPGSRRRTGLLAAPRHRPGE